MKNKLKYLIPFIPIIGMIIILNGTIDSWFNKDKYGNYKGILENKAVFISSAIVQAFGIFLVFYCLSL